MEIKKVEKLENLETDLEKNIEEHEEDSSNIEAQYNREEVEKVFEEDIIEEQEEQQQPESQLTLMEPEETNPIIEKKDIVLRAPKFKVESLIDIESKRIEAIKLPVTFGNISDKQPNNDILSIDGVEITSLGQSLYNFKYIKENGIGNRKIHLKSRECKIILEGSIYANGSIGMTRLLAYSVSKDLPFKRALEVYTFMQKILSGNQVTIKGNNLNLEVVAPQKYESLKILKIIDILYKYYSVAKEMGLNQSEKVETILKSATEINELAGLMRGRTFQTMVRLNGEWEEKLLEAKSLKLILEESVKIKNLHINYIKEILITDFILKNKEVDEKMSISWKKAELTYKKVLENSTQL